MPGALLAVGPGNLKPGGDNEMELRLAILACVVGMFIVTPTASYAQEKPSKDRPVIESPRKSAPEKALPEKGKEPPSKEKPEFPSKDKPMPPDVLQLPDPCLKKPDLPGCK